MNPLLVISMAHIMAHITVIFHLDFCRSNVIFFPSSMHRQLNFSHHFSDLVTPCLEPSMASFSLHVRWIYNSFLCFTRPSGIYLLSSSPTPRWFQPHGPSLWAHQTILPESPWICSSLCLEHWTPSPFPVSLPGTSLTKIAGPISFYYHITQFYFLIS